MIDERLIVDVGMHIGNDTEFYLAKGFRVVAVEANSDLASRAQARFSDAVSQGRLAVYNVAVADHDGETEFYVDSRHEDRGTISKGNAAYSRVLGSESSTITVQCRTFDSILRDCGIPYYLKIDIEGADALCLRALLSSTEKPKYVSVEAGVVSFQEGFDKLALLWTIGYRQFKIVNQAILSRVRCPNPPAEGEYIDQRFGDFSSGPFGEEAPGHWMSIEQTLKRYRAIIAEQALFGAHGSLYKSIFHRIYNRIAAEPVGWYDFHAK